MAEPPIVLDLIYATLGDPTLWPNVVAALASHASATAGLVFQPSAAGPRLFGAANIPLAMLDEYGRHYHRHDILVTSSAGRELELGTGLIRQEAILPRTTFHRSPFYNDFLAPNGIGVVINANLNPAEAPPPILALYRPPGAAPFSEREERRLAALLPHLRRAMRLSTAVRPAAPVVSWVAGLLDQAPHGILLLDTGGLVAHANAAGRAILDGRDGLALRDGGLAAGDRTAGPRLRAALASGAPFDLRIPRPSGSAWLLSLEPLRDAPTLRAAIHVIDPTLADSEATAGRLGALFGLTPAEQGVALGLLRGVAAAEIAAGNGTSVATVRTQIQGVFGKLGVRRQPEAAAMLAAAARLPRPG